MDCLTLDIGGTKTAAAWWHGDDLVLRREAPTPADADALLGLLARLLADAPAVQQVGAAITGTTDGRRVGVLNHHMIAGWDGLPLADRLEQLLGVPALLMNDAQAAAWGEFSARDDGVQDLMFVTVSTGIGAGVVLDGRLRRGRTGLAGHLGHVAGPDGALMPRLACSCGRRGCLERLASGTALREALAAWGQGERSARDWLSPPHAHVPALQMWLSEATQALAQAIADAHALLDLQVVVLGGGLGMQPRFLQGLRAALARLPARFQRPVEPARLGADAGLHGMARWLQRGGGALSE
jgi:N-acylmannosamine kinase